MAAISGIKSDRKQFQMTKYLLIFLLLAACEGHQRRFRPLNPLTVYQQPVLYGTGATWADTRMPFHAEWKGVVDAVKVSPRPPYTGNIMPLLERTKAKFPKSKYSMHNGDRWITPQEFAEKGGDCKGYAVSYYYALLDAGITDDRMFLMVLQLPDKSVGHIVLVVDNKYVLDNAVVNIPDYRAYMGLNAKFLPWKMNRNGYEAYRFSPGKPSPS